MTAPQVPIYTGEVPQRVGQTQAQFSANINEWVVYYQSSIPDFNTGMTYVNASLEEISSSVQLVESVVSNANFLGSWSTLSGSQVKGSTLWHDGLYWSLLDDIADITASEPSIANGDYALTAQGGNYVLIQSPFALVNPGRYYILGSGTVTIPDPATLSDGNAFDFSRQPNEQPTVLSTGGNNVTTKLGLTDGIEMGVSQTTFIVRNSLYEV